MKTPLLIGLVIAALLLGVLALVGQAGGTAEPAQLGRTKMECGGC